MLTSVCHNAKHVTNPLRNVKPTQLRMTDRRQAAVKFLYASDNTRSVEDTLQLAPYDVAIAVHAKISEKLTELKSLRTCVLEYKSNFVPTKRFILLGKPHHTVGAKRLKSD